MRCYSPSHLTEAEKRSAGLRGAANPCKNGS
jgi:hypothetical protein